MNMAINMENQVLSIEQMKHLHKLGVDTSKASMYYAPLPNGTMELKVSQPNTRYRYPTFTLQDMLALMPKQIDDYTLNWYISDMILRYDRIDCCDRFEVLESLSYSFNDNATILDVAYDMLCKLAEVGYLNKK